MPFLVLISYAQNSSVNMNQLTSVGSLGKNGVHDTVEQVYVRNCSFTNTQNGARIKTWQVKLRCFHFVPNKQHYSFYILLYFHRVDQVMQEKSLLRRSH